AKQYLSLARDGAADLLLARDARRRLLGKKNHANAILANGGQREALSTTRAPKKRIWKLNENPGAIALQRVRASGAPMGQVPQDLQTLIDDRMTLLALDMRD